MQPIRTLRYPRLEAEIRKRRLKRKDIAELLNISPQSFHFKQAGTAPFLWEEVRLMRKQYFEDMDYDILMQENEHWQE